MLTRLFILIILTNSVEVVNNTITDTSSSSSIQANNISSNDNASIPRPHGGKLINKFTAKKDVAGLFSIEVST
ncbi:MAG TPA: hypothetical protein VFR94_05955, partial [Nitrososphaeraceae archaeon]|nr:hypothetical protein [Nitrososphaeraceae archaeon]